MTKQANIILICVDQWRGDALGCAGHPVVSTPFLDQLAAKGARFKNAFSACPSCIAARAALFTGLSQEHNGRVGYKDGVDWNYPITLAGEFSKNGYHTQAIGKMHVYPERKKVGFDDVLLHDGFLHFARKNCTDLAEIDDYIPWLRKQTGRPDADYFESGLNCNSYVARPWDKEEYLHPTNFVTARSVDYLKSRRNEKSPFFLFVSYHSPHPPYDPPAWAFQQYLLDEMLSPPIGDWVDLFEPFMQNGNPAASFCKIPKRTLRLAQAGYYGHMTHIDHQINRLLESLDEFNLENTYVCFVSDHGEMLGDHNCFRKALPYRGSIGIPFILSGPRQSGIQTGLVPEIPVELRDVMPTLLECAGLPIPDGLDGKSLLSAACGNSEPVHDFIHGEHAYGQASNHWLSDGKEKYIWFSQLGKEQLFDLEKDPEECHDLSATSPRLAFWRERFIKTIKDRPEGFLDEAGNLISGRPISAVLNNVIHP